MAELTHEIIFRPAYDKRPKYGIHGVEMVWYVKGPKGVIQFVTFTNWHLPHVRKESDARILLLAKYGDRGASQDTLASDLRNGGFKKAADCLEAASRMIGDSPARLDEIQLDVEYHPQPADLGYHSPVPMYEGQNSMGECNLLGGICYYDGSGLRAEEVLETLIREGSDAVWAFLDEEYARRFEEVKESVNG